MQHKQFDPTNSELAVIGSVIVDGFRLSSVADIITPECFADRNLRAIFTALLSLSEKKAAIDAVTLADALRSKDDAIALIARIPKAIEACNYAGHAVEYAKIVKGLFLEREIITAATAVVTDQYAGTGKVAEAMSKLTVLVMAKESLGSARVFSYEKDLAGILDEIIEKGKVSLDDTGIAVLDNALLGIRPGEVVTWGAAPNAGKSLMLLNLADTAAKRGKRVLYVGTEMSAIETVQRHISIVSGIEPWKLRKGKIDMVEAGRVNDKIGDTMAKWEMNILDIAEPSVADVESAVASTKAEIVFLDYLERFKLPHGENFRLRISEFMRKVKNMARERGVIVHLASQLSRGSYGTIERRPNMADLAESSGVEKESDRIVLLWSPKEKQQVGVRRRTIEAVLVKNRHGKKDLIFDLILNEQNLRIEPEIKSEALYE